MPGDRMKRFAIAALTLLLFLLPAPSGAAEDREKDIFGSFSGREGKPTHITADRLEAYRAQEMATFSGNVVATQDDWVLHSDTLTFYFEKSESSGRGGPGKLEGGGEVSRIEARGRVRITQGERIVTGEKAVFYRMEQKAIVTGNPVLREGENVIEGDRVIVFMEEKRGVVEGTRGKRVSATIYPEEKKEKKKQE